MRQASFLSFNRRISPAAFARCLFPAEDRFKALPFGAPEAFGDGLSKPFSRSLIRFQVSSRWVWVIRASPRRLPSL